MTTKIVMEQKQITPEIAKSLLASNTRNRPLDERRANRLAAAIKRGEWVLNGDTIRISNTGVVLDGQHRLKAIFKSGCTVETIFVTGLPDSVFETIDVGGSSRTTSHVMAIQGDKHYSTLAAATRLYFIWKKTGHPTNISIESAPTTAQLLNIASTTSFSETIDITDKLAWCKKIITSSVTAFCFQVFKEHDDKLVVEFFNKLNNGVGLNSGSPILLLRERLSESKLDSIYELDKVYKIALIFKAFKLFRDGANVKTLRIRVEGNAPEKDLFVL